MGLILQVILTLLVVINVSAVKVVSGLEKNNDKTKKRKAVIWDNTIKITNNFFLSLSMDFAASRNQSNEKPVIALKVFLGELLSGTARMNYSSKISANKVHMVFYDGGTETNLEISKVRFHDQCYNIHWKSKNNNILQDCFDTEQSHWFGLGELFNQVWPLDKSSFKMLPFITTDYLYDKFYHTFGGVLEPLAVNSKGGGVHISDIVPLKVGLNEHGVKKLCIRADNSDCNSSYGRSDYNNLKYTICIADNVKSVHSILTNQFIKKPRGFPDIRMIREPLWSTWVKYRKNVNQAKILKFADKIKKHGFKASHLVIEDKYSTEYGTFNFDPKRFNDLTHMINRLRTNGIRVMVWIPPFCNLDSVHFRDGFKYWLKVGRKEVPGITKWWNGYGTILDTTDGNCKKWFKARLKSFQRMKLDGFKFDGGEVGALPDNYRFKVTQRNPNYFSHYYVKMASKVSNLVEVRVGYKSQQYPVFVRLLDRRSGWTIDDGLRSVLTATLTLSILGYPFVLPDMVGGNAYITLPNKELYLRWVQLCVFMPSIQFSIPPWDYGNDINKLALEALNIRDRLSSYIVDLAKGVQFSGNPIIRPLWWLWPKDENTFVIDTEFMLGDKYLIAPVLSSNITQHQVYLPSGIWEEQWGQKRMLYLADGKFQHYTVTLSDICYFRLVEKFTL